MVSLADFIGLVVVVGINTAVAALGTRILRVRLHTRWGVAIYVLLIVPLVQVVVTLVLTGILNLGPNLGRTSTALGIVVVLPFALGTAFDYFWMPAPEEVELPDTLEDA